MAVKKADSSVLVTSKEPIVSAIEQCPIRGVLDRIGDKWSFLLVLKLSQRLHRLGAPFANPALALWYFRGAPSIFTWFPKLKY